MNLKALQLREEGEKDVLRLKPGHLKLSGDRVFYTVQGEGDSMGKPACFLRLHLCNLTCTWCDTRYTWDKTSKEFWSESSDVATDKVAQMITEQWTCENTKITRRLIITGGEPLIQQKEIQRLVDLLPDWAIEIETNGTIPPTDSLLERCQFNCSPKLANALVCERRRIHGEVLQRLNAANTTFKFVVQQSSDLEEIDREFVSNFNLDPNKILVMPEGNSQETLTATIRSVIDSVKEKGYRVMTRLHCEIWGSSRKV